MRSRAEVEAEMRALGARIASLQEEADRSPNLKEPKVGSVIRFDVQFDEGGTVYQYVAYRYDTERWVLGRTAHPLTWSEIVSLIMLDVDVKAGRRKASFRLATDWVKVRG